MKFLKRWLPAVLGWLVLCLILLPLPSGAETPLFEKYAKAPVVLDGKLLFKVAGSDEAIAAERAEIITANLRNEIQELQESDNGPEVTIVREEDWWTLQSDGRHLLTITEGDILAGADSYRRATTWEKRIQIALEKGLSERRPVYVKQALLFSSAVFLTALLLQCALWLLGQWLPHQLKRWLKHPSLPVHPWERPIRLFVQLGILGLQTGLWLAVAAYVTDLFPQLRSGRYRLLSSLTAQVISLGGDNTRYSALQLLLLLALTFGLWFAASAVTRLFRGYVLRHTGADSGMQQVVSVLMQYTLTFLGLIILLQIWGIDIASLAILASVLGVGIGFGLQDITNNFISGVILVLERPIQPGDFIKVGDLLGTVEHIGARSTSVMTLNRVMIIVPNSQFLQNEVVNWSHTDPVSRLQIPIGVAYGSNIERVKTALLEAAKSHPDVLVRPRPEVFFMEFADSSLNFQLLAWIGDPKRQPRIKSDLNYRIAESLKRHRIEIPFPQRDLHVRSPQLQALVDAIRHQHFPNSPVDGKSVSTELFLSQHGDKTEAVVPASTDAAIAPSDSTQLYSEEWSPEEIDLDALVEAMRGPDGLEIKDRFYRLNLYPRCFIGSDAVKWMVETQDWTREVAIDVGQILMDRHIIHHVLDEKSFQDEYLFYRFYVDE